MLRKLKWFALGLLCLLILILCLQNLATIQLRFLFSTVELPQAIVIFGVLLVGFIMGLLANALWKVRAWRARVSREKQQRQETSTTQESKAT
jgi:uncharacterized integral membrane protein